MTRSTRRSFIRAGGGLAVAATITGCTGRSDGVASANDGLPGVEDGEIVDRHAFASGHHDQLETRSGTLKWTNGVLDREAGDAERHSVRTVRVDGDRILAAISGKTGFPKPDVDRVEFYFEGTTAYYRSRSDGEWETWSAGPDAVAFSPSDFTGKSRLETVGPSKVGTETVDGEELYRFSAEGPMADDDGVEWFSVQALVDPEGLVRSFRHTLDETRRDARRFEEWYATDLGATTVDRPDWVEE